MDANKQLDRREGMLKNDLHNPLEVTTQAEPLEGSFYVLLLFSCFGDR